MRRERRGPGLRACTEARSPGDVAWAIERTVRVETGPDLRLACGMAL